MTFTVALLSALWLGLLTSVSPCPLASNIAAISFIGRKAHDPRQVLLSGVLYAAGRTAAYVALGALVMTGLLLAGDLSRFLQQYLNQLLGPVLILAGLLLLEWLGAGWFNFNLAGGRLQARAARGGPGWAFVLGVLFALSLCPVSAGLFFGGLIPLAVAQQSRLAIPALFGVGTAVPVIAFSGLIAFATRQVGAWFNRLASVEKWVRFITGAVFILVGLYYCLSRFQKSRLFRVSLLML